MTKNDENLIIDKSPKLKTNHFTSTAWRGSHSNCVMPMTIMMKQYRKRIIINQSHKSEQHRNVIVIGMKKRNVMKSCMSVTKSLNNDTTIINCCFRRQRRRENECLDLSRRTRSRHLNLHTNLLNQLFQFDGLLIFITAISQQGEIFYFYSIKQLKLLFSL